MKTVLDVTLAIIAFILMGFMILSMILTGCSSVKNMLKNPEQLNELYCSNLWVTCDVITDDNRLPCLIQTSICAAVTPDKPMTRKDANLLRDMERRLSNERD